MIQALVIAPLFKSTKWIRFHKCLNVFFMLKMKYEW
jgi:hypothetical protein